MSPIAPYQEGMLIPMSSVIGPAKSDVRPIIPRGLRMRYNDFCLVRGGRGELMRRSSWLFAGLTACIVSSAYANSWTLISSTQDGESFYLDTSSISASAESKTANFRHESASMVTENIDGVNITYRSTSGSISADCLQGRVRRYERFFTGPSGSGQRITAKTTASFIPVQKTPIYHAYVFLCGSPPADRSGIDNKAPGCYFINGTLKC